MSNVKLQLILIDLNIFLLFLMLSGEGDYKDTDNQLKFNMVVCTQLIFASKKTWIKLPGPGKQIEELYKIRQEPNKLFQDFVFQLMTTAGRH